MKKIYTSLLLALFSFSSVFYLWHLIFIIKNQTVWVADFEINALMSSLHSSDAVNTLFIYITEMFDPKIFLLWFFILLGILWLNNKREEVLFLFLGVAGGQTIKIIMKFLTDRDRPENPFFLSAHESSFPSGHATTSVFIFLAIGYLFTQKLNTSYKLLSRLFLLLLALLVPFSRVFVQVHYTSDVVAGICLGLASFASTIIVFEVFKSFMNEGKPVG